MAPITPETRNVWLPRSLAAILIVGAAVARIVYLGWFSALDLAPDEAHYWDWSRHLDWSYYSKGPLVALLIRGSCELFGSLSIAWTGSEMLAVRLPAVLCGALLATGLYVLIVQTWKRETLALGGVILAMTFPMLAAGSSLITIDAPLTCLWTWALVTGFEAAVRQKAWAWPVTGLLIALGILAKPTMVLWLPCFGLFLLATPAARPLLWRREFWIMSATAFLGAIPLIYWNSQNDWVTWKHTGGHAGMNARQFLYPLGPLNYLGTQIALLLVYWFVVWAAGLWRYRPWMATTRLEERYLWWMSAPIFIFFGIFSLKNGGGEPNWPIVCYLAGMVLAVGWIQEKLTSPFPWPRRLTIFGISSVACVGILATVILHFPIHAQPLYAALAGPKSPDRPMPIRRLDPTARMRGWQTLASAVETARADVRKTGVEPILAGMNWTLPGEISFYLPDHPNIYALGPAQGERQSQYDLWRPNPLADPDHFRGKTFVMINADPPILAQMFDTVERRDIVEYREGDYLMCYWSVAICHGFRGCPVIVNKKH